MQVLVNDGYHVCDCCGYRFRNGQCVLETTEGYYHINCFREHFGTEPEETDKRKVVSE